MNVLFIMSITMYCFSFGSGENINLFNLPIISKSYRKSIAHKWIIFVQRLSHLCLSKTFSKSNFIIYRKERIMCIKIKITVDNCEGNKEYSANSKHIIKPFGYLCGRGGEGNIGMKTFIHRFDFGAHFYDKTNVLRLGSKQWYAIVAGDSFLGLNITFLSFSLANIDPGYFSLFERLMVLKIAFMAIYPTFLTCTLEFVYVDFYKQSDFRHSYFDSFGPYCGYRSPWTLFSTGNAKIYFRTFENSPSFFMLHYQAIDLGYVVTTSVLHENAVWLHDKTEETEMHIQISKGKRDYIRSGEIHGGWKGRFSNFLE